SRPARLSGTARARLAAGEAGRARRRDRAARSQPRRCRLLWPRSRRVRRQRQAARRRPRRARGGRGSLARAGGEARPPRAAGGCRRCPAVAILPLLLVTLVWGFNFAVVKIGLAQLPPILFVSLRFFLVAALLLPFLKRPRHKRGLILLLGITLGVIHFSMFFLGVSGLEVSTAAIAIQLQVPFASILAAIVCRDR